MLVNKIYDTTIQEGFRLERVRCRFQNRVEDGGMNSVDRRQYVTISR